MIIAIKKIIFKIFKIQPVCLSLSIFYKRNNIYYPTLRKAVLNKKDEEFNKNIKKRIEVGESKWFAEVIGKSFVEGLERGLKGKDYANRKRFH